ncbi:DUF3824 domain-containing protein [Actinoplanes sp. NPDC026619]|uniref:DUF3824 domain-containing protein n=1 Tax=Actinoplanes sp. NPDC026619 TaxID=3155798 RepID=UPI0033E0DC60
MNLLKSKLRRSATVVGGAFLGLAGVAAFAAPALACETEITPISKCANADGSWVVEWKVTNSEWEIEGKVVKAVALPTISKSTLTGLDTGAVLPAERDGVLKGTQTLPAGENTAQISVQSEWKWNGGGYVSTSKSREIHKPKHLDHCKPTTPPDNPNPGNSFPNPGNSFPNPGNSFPNPGNSFPNPGNSFPNPSGSFPTPGPSDSSEPTPHPSGSTNTPTPATEPQFVYDTTCDTFTVGLEVPKDWPESITVTFKPSTGDSKTITVKPGATGTVDFPASEGLKVTATPKGYEDEAATIAYETPADCDSDGGGGGLPVTGAAAGGIAGGAAVLLALGAGMFFMARRRKVKFTA